MLKTLISLLLVFFLTSTHVEKQISQPTRTINNDRVETTQIKKLDCKDGYNETELLMLSVPTIKIKSSAISVSSLKITWTAEENHQYSISCVRAGNDSSIYDQNIRLECKGNDTCYITGLRENTTYIIKVKDIMTDAYDEILARTEKVTVIEEYNYVTGWTNCFAYESASGLTRNPSKAAIANAISDPITDTGIMRNEYGDYCVAMGLYYGECGDRFLVELTNGTQFTVAICDSKGYADDGQGIYHTFGFSGEGKCLIEFIHGADLPSRVAVSGNYGSYNWDGLIFDNIKSIKRIEYGNTVEY